MSPCPSSSGASSTRASTTGCATCSRCPGRSRSYGPTRFAEIGGFDEAISFLGDDLSLAWRARLAGAKVLVTSAAQVRHAEAFAGRPDGGAAVSRLAARHRIRVLLSSYRLSSLVAIVPQALVLSVVEAVGAVVTGRPARARAALGAWPWNLWHLRSLVAARREVRQFRIVGDREVHRHQVRGLVGPRLTLRRVGAGGSSRGFGASSRRVAAVPVRGKMDVDPAAWSPGTALAALTVAGVVALGSRHLLTRYVPVVGELVPAGGGVGDLLGAWAGGWRPVGLGADGATPGLTGALGLLGAGLFGQVGLARTLLTVGLVPVGIVGAHRLLAPSGSKRAQVAAAVAYAAVPLPYDALATGRWSALAAYAGAPWMLGRLARASGVTPFGRRPTRSMRRSRRPAWRTSWSCATACGSTSWPPGRSRLRPGCSCRRRRCSSSCWASPSCSARCWRARCGARCGCWWRRAAGPRWRPSCSCRRRSTS